MKSKTTLGWCGSVIGQILAGLMLGILGVSVALAQLPQTNPAGVSLVRESASAWSFSEQTNPAGVTLQLTAGADSAAEITNPAGVTVFIGLIDGEIRSNAAGVSWTMYEDPAQP